MEPTAAEDVHGGLQALGTQALGALDSSGFTSPSSQNMCLPGTYESDLIWK